MKNIKEKDTVIQFKENDFLGNSINLFDFKNQKVLLSFFRGASCPFSNMRLRELIKRQPEFEARGIKVITFFASTSRHFRICRQTKASFSYYSRS